MSRSSPPTTRKPNPLDGYGEYDFPMPSSSKATLNATRAATASSFSSSSTTTPFPQRPPPPQRPSGSSPPRSRPVPRPIQVPTPAQVRNANGAGGGGGGGVVMMRQNSGKSVTIPHHPQRRRSAGGLKPPLGFATRPRWEFTKEDEYITDDDLEPSPEDVEDGSPSIRKKQSQTQMIYRPAYFTTTPTQQQHYYPTAYTTSGSSSTPSTAYSHGSTPPSPITPFNWDVGYSYNYSYDEEEKAMGYKGTLRRLCSSASLRNRGCGGQMKPTPSPKVTLPIQPVQPTRSRSPRGSRPLRWHWEALSLRVRFGVFKAQKKFMACFTPPPETL